MISYKDFKSVVIVVAWFLPLYGGASGARICNVDNNTSVLPICSQSVQTGSTFHIDTSAVPADEAIMCTCSVFKNTDTVIRSIEASYQLFGEDYSICGLQFKVSNVLFLCTDTGRVSIEGNLTTIIFSKKLVDADACLSIFIDSRWNKREKVTISCNNAFTTSYTKTEKHTTAETYGTTGTDTELMPKPISSTINSFNTNVSSNNNTTTISSNGGSGTQSFKEKENNEENTVIIAAAAGGGGACLLVVCVVISICCCRHRRRKSATNFPPRHAYVGTTSDHEVTENVVYNMEFTDETKHVPLETTAATYDSVSDDRQQQDAADISSPDVYSNLRMNDDRETYNTVALDQNHHPKKIPTSVKYNNLHLKDDAGNYNTVGFNEKQDLQNKESCNLPLQPEQDNNPLYDTSERKTTVRTINETNSPVAERSQESLLTYAVLNKNRSNDKGKTIDRPKQFKVAESGDTYAVVNKKNEN